MPYTRMTPVALYGLLRGLAGHLGFSPIKLCVNVVVVAVEQVPTAVVFACVRAIGEPLNSAYRHYLADGKDGVCPIHRTHLNLLSNGIST